MSLRRLITKATIVIAVLGATASVAGTAAAATPDYSAIVSQFMCVSCHEPLELVSSPQAISEKQTLQGFVSKGLTMPQIKAAMVAQYGPEVLARPPASGFNLTVYILPPVIFLAGLGLLAYTLPKWRARSRRAAATRLAAATPLAPDEAKRLDDELTDFI
ncbi:MAG TPA: cytochrome c-type biogenesis protein CcmH [Solirubrobacteraceae bacterium]|jgi:cytochrome c-type biogenesis protein CcmH/NrfF|nr:cytochrome c-type biogenesis protein CcmH [Solirubrobacteraceae bacterium]